MLIDLNKKRFLASFDGSLTYTSCKPTPSVYPGTLAAFIDVQPLHYMSYLKITIESYNYPRQRDTNLPDVESTVYLLRERQTLRFFKELQK